MNKIKALALGVLESYKVDSRIERIKSSISIAELNLKDKKNEAISLYDTLLERLAKDGDIPTTINDMVKCKKTIEVTDKALSRLEMVKQDLFEEVEPDKKKK